MGEICAHLCILGLSEWVNDSEDLLHALEKKWNCIIIILKISQMSDKIIDKRVSQLGEKLDKIIWNYTELYSHPKKNQLKKKQI